MVKKTIGLEELSSITGYSKMTISRALNEPEKVKASSREKILEAVSKHNYQQNSVARALCKGKTNIIYIYIPKHLKSSNPFYLNVVAGIGERLGERGYSMLIRKEWYSHEVCDGIILMGLGQEDVEKTQILAQDKQIVLFGHIDGVDSIDINNYLGMKMMGDYVLSRGYKRILYLSINEQRIFVADRMNGFVDAVATNAEFAIEVCPNNTADAYKHIKKVYKNYASYDSIVCGSDDIAIGVIRYLAERGIDVPGKVGVSGFDGLGTEVLSIPHITTIHQPIVALGSLLADSLIDKIEKNIIRNEITFVDPILVKNGSI